MQQMDIDRGDDDHVMEDADPLNKQKYSSSRQGSRRSSGLYVPEEQSNLNTFTPSSAARRYSPMMTSPTTAHMASPGLQAAKPLVYTSSNSTQQQQQLHDQSVDTRSTRQSPSRQASYNATPQDQYASPPSARPQHSLPPLQFPLSPDPRIPGTAQLNAILNKEARSPRSPQMPVFNPANKGPVPQFQKVNSTQDLRPRITPQPPFRRANPEGGFISPLQALTTQLASTYRICNPTFQYETSRNPRRVLTKPSKGTKNDGYDNEDSDYILYVNDILGNEETNHKNRYLILDVLGQGTFGQVVKCQNLKTQEVVAVKVVKNKTAYFNQSMMEVSVLDLLNSRMDKNDDHHILRLKDTFIHRQHLCLTFELLSVNLYELIKQNQFRGLSTTLVRVFAQQLLVGLCLLSKARLIHCDLKPENILLKNLESPIIKIIDFGSACDERQTVYTYIQSRFYRSPEVLLGLPYSAAIDMWSLGCIVVELFLGLPLFPGSSEYNQVSRITEMLGLPPNWMLEVGKQSGEFFEKAHDEFGRRSYRLRSMEQYSRDHGNKEQPSKKYFSATTLPEIIKNYPMPRKGMKQTEIDREMQNRVAFIDFVHGLLNINPLERWTPQQARTHPFITQQKFTGPFQPQMNLKTNTSRPPAPGLQQQQQAEAMSKQRAQVANQQQQQAVQAQQMAVVAAQQQQQQQYYAQDLSSSYPISPHHGMSPGGMYAPLYGQSTPSSTQPTIPQINALPSLSGTSAHQTPHQQSLHAQATLRSAANTNATSSNRPRASTLDLMSGIPASLQRVVSHLDPNAPIRLQPSPAYYAPPPLSATDSPSSNPSGGSSSNIYGDVLVAGRAGRGSFGNRGGLGIGWVQGTGNTSTGSYVGGPSGMERGSAGMYQANHMQGQVPTQNQYGGYNNYNQQNPQQQRNFVRALEDRTLEEGWNNPYGNTNTNASVGGVGGSSSGGGGGGTTSWPGT